MTDPLTMSFDEMEQMANDQQKGRYAGDKNLMIQFHTLPMMDTQKSQDEGRPIYRDVEHVRILIPGSKESVVDKVVTDIERRRFKDLYEKWKANEQLDFTGTPLESCTWMAKSLVEEMKFFHVRTVEQLAELSDTHAQKFPGIRQYINLAKAYIAQAEKGKAASDLAAAMDAQKKENEDLREMIRGLQETLARLEGSAPPSPAPKPRGRRASA